MAYTRLSLAEREEISISKAQGFSHTAIALKLGRHPSTIWREWKRYPRQYLVYRAVVADKHARLRTISCHRRRTLNEHVRLRTFVIAKLRLAWSPEQIAQELKRVYSQDSTMRISHEAIYTYLYCLPRGSLRKELLQYLRQHHRTRWKRKREKRARKEQIPNLISIEERPAEVADRTIPGHWEGDLIIGRYHHSALGTLVERTTRTTILVPLTHWDAVSVANAFARELKSLPRQMRLTLTYDRGREMTRHELFTRQTRMRVYFAHPQSPWERGTNENTNGLIRQFFPKGTNFKKVTRREIKQVQHLLNGRPRKVLGWQKPFEVFNKLIALES